MAVYTFKIEEKLGRIDKFLAEQIPGLSRSKIQTLIEEKIVLVNQASTKSNYELEVGDEIYLDYEEEVEELIPEEGPLNILYEDEDILVVNKVSGQVVHPSPGHPKGSLANYLLAYTSTLSNLNGPMRPGIVHRLDKDTSGVLVIAKNNASHFNLAQQFKERKPLREYLALVHGHMETQAACINLPLGRDPKQRTKFAVVSDGKEAISHFQVEESFKSTSLLKVRLETGRTHQIRVHLSHLKHAVVGDRLYGSSKKLEGDKYCLHALKIGFQHPKQETWMEFTAPLEDHFQSLLEQLRKTQSLDD